MPSAIHADLAGGRWQEFSLVEQLGNIGSEVSRALKARARGDRERELSAVERGLELFDLTLADPKHRGRRKEICRAREVVCDFFLGDNEYQTDGESLDRYFLTYAIAARLGARPSRPLR
ncbi:MAG: hypothetical protein ACKVX7_19825 [Planctomycetota bacterium]